MISENTKSYYDLKKRNDVRESAKRLRRQFLRYKDAEIVYSLQHKKLLELASKAGAIYRMDGTVLINWDIRSIFEEYLRQQCKSNDREKRLSLYEPDDEITVEEENDTMRQGVLVPDLQSGRMDIRFSLEDYYGGLHCGTTMDVNIDGKWIPTRIEMGDDWYLVGIKTNSLPGLTVRI